MKYYDVSGLAARRHDFALRTAKYLMDKYSDDGKWLRDDLEMGLREQMFGTSALFETGEEVCIRLANRIIQNGVPGYRHCHFMPFTIAQCFWHYENLLEEASVQALDGYFLKYLDKFLQPGMDFVGANDNFPCMATAVALFGALRYGREDCMQVTRKRLHQLAAMRKRSDFCCEYNSPTYTAISLLAIAEVANHAPEELRQLALDAEAWFWKDLLIHYHGPTAQMAPPYSRAYPTDYTACTHQARFAYYALFGDKLPITPVETLTEEEGCYPGMIIHHNPDFQRVSCFWILMADYHCPEQLALDAWNRKYPFLVEGRSDPTFWCKLDTFPALPAPSEPVPPYSGVPFQDSYLYTYMSKRYALGTSRFPFLRGDQTSSIQLNYVKDAPAKLQPDVKTLFTRYVINDQPLVWDSDSFVDFGQKLAIQRENSAMVLYWPTYANNEKITSLRLTFNVSALYALPDEVWLGDRKLTDYEGESDTAETIFIRDGKVCMAIRPLLGNDGWEGTRVRVRAENRLLTISLINYEGEPRDFPRNLLANMGNGAVVEIRDTELDGSFEEFRKNFRPELYELRRENTHHVCYDNGKSALGIQYNPFTRSIRWCDTAPSGEALYFTGD